MLNTLELFETCFALRQRKTENVSTELHTQKNEGVCVTSQVSRYERVDQHSRMAKSASNCSAYGKTDSKTSFACSEMDSIFFWSSLRKGHTHSFAYNTYDSGNAKSKSILSKILRSKNSRKYLRTAAVGKKGEKCLIFSSFFF